MANATRTPAIGDPFWFEGLAHTITGMTDARVQFSSVLENTRDELQEDGSVKTVTLPRFISVCNRSDLRWSDELGAWYLWGRLLCKGRGAKDRLGARSGGTPDLTGQVGADERLIVRDLRDMGILPARETRMLRSVPAGGEHFNLHCCLFRHGVNWTQEIANVKRGEGLSSEARACLAEYETAFAYALPDGFAYPGATDSTGKTGRPAFRKPAGR